MILRCNMILVHIVDNFKFDKPSKFYLNNTLCTDWTASKIFWFDFIRLDNLFRNWLCWFSKDTSVLTTIFLLLFQRFLSRKSSLCLFVSFIVDITLKLFLNDVLVLKMILTMFFCFYFSVFFRENLLSVFSFRSSRISTESTVPPPSPPCLTLKEMNPWQSRLQNQYLLSQYLQAPWTPTRPSRWQIRLGWGCWQFPNINNFVKPWQSSPHNQPQYLQAPRPSRWPYLVGIGNNSQLLIIIIGFQLLLLL